MISKAHSVIGISSTLCYKPIQLGIPTAILDGGNFIGCFSEFSGFCSLNSIEHTIDSQLNNGRDNEYIKTILTGGIDYSSINIYIKHITTILNEI